jgi:hypothetical protein
MKDEQTIRYKVVIDAPEEISELVNAYEDYIRELGEEINELVSVAHVNGWKSTRLERGLIARKRIADAKEAILPNANVVEVSNTSGFPKEISSAYINGQKWAFPKMLWYSFLYGASKTFDNNYLPAMGYVFSFALILSGYAHEQDAIYFIATIAYLFAHAVFHASSAFHNKYSEPKKSLY